ncbi:BTB/POZ domain-containing protein 2 [Orchesella cincta]|uniref:BTB/POZ domain-containing protein 2 n=1 Tax=Orchesella cincta TaxID=48709 RepID=A0A1D2NL19_ORCCI|nr:BTB/POZ domain-containing protein 2 [Orchesella cincta]
MAGVANNVRAMPTPPRKPVSPPLVDWRRTCPGVNGKLKHLLGSGLLMDVTFRVGNEKGEVETIRAHKLMLAMFSSVFEAMFMGRFVENRDSVDDIIAIPDIQPSAFKTLLKFIYVGEMSRQLSTSDILGTLYAAKKYDITELEMECTQLLKSNISEENAVSIFQAAQMFDEKELREEAHAFLKRNFDIAMQRDDFLNISKENLCIFLQDDDTFASELSIFHGVLRWAETECSRMNISGSPDNQRLVLADILELVRLPVITSEDIALEVIPSRILTPEECTLLLQYKVVTPQNRALLPSLPFTDRRRSFSAYKAVFYDEMKGKYVDLSTGWYNRFSVDQPISIVSFGFYGPYTVDNASYTVSIKLLKDESENCPVLAEATYQNVVVKVKEIFHVNFPHPIPIHPGILYRAWFSLKGPLTCHGAAVSNTMEVVVPVNTRYQNVKFTYSVIGAHQLPEIMFQV